LKDAIDAAKALYNAAKPGDSVGQYPPEAIAALDAAITVAEGVLIELDAALAADGKFDTQKMADAINSLNTAVNTFKDTVIGGSGFYTVTYDKNGATGGSVPVDPNSPYQSGDSVTVLGNTGNLVRDGYTFAGWSLTVGGIAVGETVTMGDADIVLYAKWLKNEVASGADYKVEGNTITYEAVPNGTTTKLINPALPLGATGQLYKDAACTEPIAGNIMSLPNVGPNKAYYKVKYGNGDEDVFTINIERLAAGATPPPGPNPKPPSSSSSSGAVYSDGGILSGGKPASAAFIDIAGHWAQADIENMKARGIVAGVTETTFEPDRSVTRAEFATLIARSLGLSGGGNVFNDVVDGEWFTAYVNAAAQAGIIVGYDGYFRPNDLIKREEMAVIMSKTYAFKALPVPAPGGIEIFADKDDISDWAYRYVDTATSAGLISGMTPTTFVPQNNTTRAQATSVIKRLLDK